MTEQEQRKALFQKKAEIGKARNDAALKIAKEYADAIRVGKYSPEDALLFVFAEGCDYGKNNAEELKIFDK